MHYPIDLLASIRRLPLGKPLPDGLVYHLRFTLLIFSLDDPLLDIQISASSTVILFGFFFSYFEILQPWWPIY
jgi:hypothetical protein